ncbi:MAG: TIGR02444 family protein [Xanthobacteraceae bacterium]
MSDSVSLFWTFSLKVYAEQAVADVCLNLQDRFDADVNVLLFMLWCADQGRRLSRQEIGAIINLVTPWQVQVVRPLRLARRSLKMPPSEWPLQEAEALRRRVKADELEAERLQQQALARFAEANDVGQPDTARAASLSNLKNYANALNVAFPDQAIAILAGCISNRD